MTGLTSKYLLDIETDDIDATKIYCIVLKKINGNYEDHTLSFDDHEVYTYEGSFGYPSLTEFRIKFDEKCFLAKLQREEVKKFDIILK